MQRTEQLVLWKPLELYHCIPMLKGEPDYVYNIMTKVVMDSRDDTGRKYAMDLLNKTLLQPYLCDLFWNYRQGEYSR